jgi:transcriptional regulator with XRE-family HTH domain
VAGIILNDMFFILHQGAEVDELSARLAKNLRRLRIASRQSLSELARATAVSKATLSGIERGTGNPTIQTLAALARVLRVGVPELLGEPALGEVRIARAERKPDRKATSVNVRMLETLPVDGQLELSQVNLPGGTTCELAAATPGSRKQVLVLTGTLIAGPAERISELSRGDYISFPADVPHLYEAPRGPARALVAAHTPA